jgi:hypothetical protein
MMMVIIFGVSSKDQNKKLSPQVLWLRVSLECFRFFKDMNLKDLTGKLS